MAPKWLFLLACVVAFWAVDLGQAASSSHHAHAPSPSVDCTTLAATNLVDCLSFVTKESTIAKPQGTCCSGLKSILKSAPNCLCEAFKSSAQFGVELNVSKALTLPAACKLSAPSVSNCALSLSPAAAPGPSPSSVTGNQSLPAGAPSPSPGNTASVLIPFSIGSLIVCLLVSMFAPAFVPF